MVIVPALTATLMNAMELSAPLKAIASKDKAVIQKVLPLLQSFREEIHRFPELSGEEEKTAERITAFLEKHAPPSKFIHKIGGHGLAAVYEGKEDGPTVLFRAELDALPIKELNDFAYASTTEGVSHKCGHDGHMCTLAGLGSLIAANPIGKGRVVLMFQPAEETGAGAAAVVNDPKYKELLPQYAFAYHNLPGKPLGSVMVKPGPFAMASRGLDLQLTGATSHAAHPEDGNSPALAVSELLAEFTAIATPPGTSDDAFQLVTVVHASMGEAHAFGVTPGQAVIQATLRCATDDGMEEVIDRVVKAVDRVTDKYQLKYSYEWSDVFHATMNHDEAVDTVVAGAKAMGITSDIVAKSNRWSEDFGEFSRTTATKAALFCVGSGDACPPLHHQTYDFPIGVFEPALSTFAGAMRALTHVE